MIMVKMCIRDRRKLGHLLIPIGPYSLDVLEHLVATFSAEHCPAFMAEEVAATWQEFQDYQDLRCLLYTSET